jgi:hypothetical protein
VLKERLLETPKFGNLRLLARASPACRVAARIMNSLFLVKEHPRWIGTNRAMPVQGENPLRAFLPNG